MAAQLYLYGGMAALQMAGGYFAAQNIKDTARLNQQIGDMNAEFAELDAYDATIEGYSQQARYQSVIDETLQAQELAMTSAGVDPTYGTAASLTEETKFIAEMNLMEIEKQAQEQALGYTRQARDFRMGGAMQFAEGQRRAGEVMFQSTMAAAKTGVTGYRRSL